jgi:ABC-type enterochelin transport system permease subunit
MNNNDEKSILFIFILGIILFPVFHAFQGFFNKILNAKQMNIFERLYNNFKNIIFLILHPYSNR